MLNDESSGGKPQPERDDGDWLIEYLIQNWHKLSWNTREWIFYCVWRRSVRRRNTPPNYHRYTTFSDGDLIHTEEN